MKLLLRIQDIHFRDSTWRQNSSILIDLFHFLDTLGLWNPFQYIEYNGLIPKPIAKTFSVSDKIQNQNISNLKLLTDLGKSPAGYLDLDLTRHRLGIKLKLDKKYKSDSAKNLLDSYISIIKNLWNILDHDHQMGPFIDVEVQGMRYPRVRPPRHLARFTFGTLLSAFSERFHAEHRLGKNDDFKKILRSKTPDFVDVLNHNGLWIFKWMANLEDIEEVKRRRSDQEKWLVDLLNPPIKSNFNSLGDCRFIPFGLKKDTLLTFYASDQSQGFKAIVPNYLNEIDKTLVYEFKQWISKKRLPDGRPLEELSLILPNRNAALQVREQSIDIGIKRIFYTNNLGELWNPFPPGPWRESPPRNPNIELT